MGKLSDVLLKYRTHLRELKRARTVQEKHTAKSNLSIDFNVLAEVYLDDSYQWDADDEKAEHWLLEHADDSE